MSYLDTYQGEWNEAQARHLLRRTTFGPTQQTIEEAVKLGFSATVDKLFEVREVTDFPVKYLPDGDGKTAINDPDVKFGETWINAPVIPDVSDSKLKNRILRYRRSSLYAWTIKQLFNETISIREKMFLFWHNHFVAENTLAHRVYVYADLLRANALGNFKQLTKDITIDSNMLYYLSGYKNTKSSPNENYARELLELFTVGKGDLIAPGDYSNYTEDDVVEMAKCLTGWKLYWKAEDDILNAYFRASHHSEEDKHLSYHFDNKVVKNNGENEYKDLIDIIFQHEGCSRFISRNLYRWFVDSEINSDIEENIIEPMSKIIRDNDYEIAPALKALISSEFFMNKTACAIKPPVDIILSASKGLGFVTDPENIEEEYTFFLYLYYMIAELGQRLFRHTNVAGWKAYYQSPGYDKLWLNTMLLPKRNEYCRLIIEGGIFKIGTSRFKSEGWIDVITVTMGIDNAHNVDDLIEALSNRLFCQPVSELQREKLKQIFLDGYTEKDWTDAWGKIIQDTANGDLWKTIDKHLRKLFAAMLQMSEFQVY